MRQYDITVENVMNELNEFNDMCEAAHQEVKDSLNDPETSSDIYSPEFLRQT